jgi:DNA mismatch repair protein MutL
MGRVRILDDALADQIAAGEVVERPASVAKELLENALDAGARSITVELSEGGSGLLRVTDDGSGMDAEDAALCVRRHATSKIRAREDLEAIRTLGFRGEALPSIASVSRFRLVTRTRESVEGTEVVIEGGSPPRVSPAGCAVGTSIEVRDLFYNVPARRKFLKSTTTESAQVGEVCLRAALVDPGLRLVLVRDGRRAREYLPAADWAERAAHVLEGKRVRIEGEHRGVHVRAVLGAPEDARTGAVGLHVFVNGRPVRERNLARSVAFAYGSVMPPGRYPVGVVHVEVEPGEVDVNVHPQKHEVRFQRGREVLDAVTRVLADGLGTSAWKGPAARGADYWQKRLPSGPVTPDSAIGVPRDSSEPDPWGLTNLPPPPPSPLPPPHAHAHPTPHGTPTAHAIPNPHAPGAPNPHATPTAHGLPARQPALPYAITHAPLVAPRDAEPHAIERAAPYASGQRALAQAKRLYVIAETASGLCIIDQHAADERIQYARLRKQYQARDVKQQRLLLPERVELSEREAALIESHAEQIAPTGIDVSLIGPTTAAVHAVPAILRRAAPERLLRDLLDELSRAGDRGFGDRVDMALATMACHGAIRAGDALSLAECQALLDELARIDDFGGHCPHGRPIVLEMPFDELARKVGR